MHRLPAVEWSLSLVLDTAREEVRKAILESKDGFGYKKYPQISHHLEFEEHTPTP